MANEMMYLNDAPATPQKSDFIEKLRNFVRNQKRGNGYQLALAAGSNTFNLTISGTARIMLGFTLMADTPDNSIDAISMTLTINNEVIIDKVNPNFFTSFYTNEGYYFFPRPLNGSDKVELKMVGTIGANIANMIIYYV